MAQTVVFFITSTGVSAALMFRYPPRALVHIHL